MGITRRNAIKLGLAGIAGMAISHKAFAAQYPSHPITFICPWPAGGTADATMRALCKAASQELGQPIVLENRPGAAGMLGLQILSRAKPDGYTIGQVPISVTRLHQLGTTQINPLEDLSYICRTSGQTFGVVVTEESPFKSMKGVIDFARKNPGKLTYATSGAGGAPHVGMEQLCQAAGITLNHIPFKGGSEAMQAVLGGHVQMLVDSSAWAPSVRAGKMRLLATWGSQRSSEFKDVPTVSELGYPVIVDAPNGVGTPPNLDPDAAQVLRKAFAAAVQSDDFKTACAQIDVPIMYLDGPQYTAYVKKTYAEEKVTIEKIQLKKLLGLS